MDDDPVSAQSQQFPFVVGDFEACAAFCRSLMQLSSNPGPASKVMAGMAPVHVLVRMATGLGHGLGERSGDGVSHQGAPTCAGANSSWLKQDHQ